MDRGQVLGGGTAVDGGGREQSWCGGIVDVDDAHAQRRAFGGAAPRAEIRHAVEPDELREAEHGSKRGAHIHRQQRIRGRKLQLLRDDGGLLG